MGRRLTIPSSRCPLAALSLRSHVRPSAVHNGATGRWSDIGESGGVICGAVEPHSDTANHAVKEIEEKIRVNTREVLENARAARTGAAGLARQRVVEPMSYRRNF